jgi:hypothetical protein
MSGHVELAEMKQLQHIISCSSICAILTPPTPHHHGRPGNLSSDQQQQRNACMHRDEGRLYKVVQVLNMPSLSICKM